MSSQDKPQAYSATQLSLVQAFETFFFKNALNVFKKKKETKNPPA